jgi:hypothetical protein
VNERKVDCTHLSRRPFAKYVKCEIQSKSINKFEAKVCREAKTASAWEIDEFDTIYVYSKVNENTYFRVDIITLIFNSWMRASFNGYIITQIEIKTLMNFKPAIVGLQFRILTLQVVYCSRNEKLMWENLPDLYTVRFPHGRPICLRYYVIYVTKLSYLKD